MGQHCPVVQHLDITGDCLGQRLIFMVMASVTVTVTVMVTVMVTIIILVTTRFSRRNRRGNPEPGLPSLNPKGWQGQPGQHQGQVIVIMDMVVMVMDIPKAGRVNLVNTRAR